MRRTPTSVKSESGTNKNSAASGGCSGIEAKKLKTVSNYQFQTTSNKKKMSLRTKSVMRIQLNYYTDPDPGSGNPPYKSGSGSKEKTSQNSIFPNFVEKTYLPIYCRTAALYKIGKGPKRTAEVTEELQSSMRMAKVTGGQLRSHEVIWGRVRLKEFNWGDIL